MWKNGIHWTTEDGIEVVVEVSEQHHCVSVMLSMDEMNSAEHVKLCSALITEILAILHEFCLQVGLEEYVIPSCEVMQSLGHHDLAEMNAFLADIQKGVPLSSFLYM